MSHKWKRLGRKEENKGSKPTKETPNKLNTKIKHEVTSD